MSSDGVALRDLVERYALHVDRRALTQLVELFTPDGVLVVPRPPESLAPTYERRGRDAIRAAMASLDHYAVTLHAVVGHVVDAVDTVDGSAAATGVVTCLAHHVLDDRASVWALRYDDDYVKVDGVWRFRRRALTIDWIEDRPVSQVRRGT